jgi:hypothetical protein
VLRCLKNSGIIFDNSKAVSNYFSFLTAEAVLVIAFTPPHPPTVVTFSKFGAKHAYSKIYLFFVNN